MAQANGEDKLNIVPFPEGGGKRGDAPEPPSGAVINLPPAVKAICLTIIVAYLLELALPYVFGLQRVDDWKYLLSVVVGRYTGDAPFDVFAVISPVTHMFLHGGMLHLGVNTVSLMAFGAGLEKHLGARRMLVLYFASGLLGALLHGILTSYTLAPMIGASGAISGLFGAIIVQMRDMDMLGGQKRLMPFVIIWLAASLAFGLFGMPGAEGVIAWATHVGGFIAGMVLYKPVARMA